jgi:hypothetical protein
MPTLAQTIGILIFYMNPFPVLVSSQIRLLSSKNGSWFENNTRPSTAFYGNSFKDNLGASLLKHSHSQREMARVSRLFVAHPGLLVCAHSNRFQIFEDGKNSIIAAFTRKSLHAAAAKQRSAMLETRVISGSLMAVFAVSMLRAKTKNCPTAVNLNHVCTLSFDDATLNGAMTSLYLRQHLICAARRVSTTNLSPNLWQYSDPDSIARILQKSTFFIPSGLGHHCEAGLEQSVLIRSTDPSCQGQRRLPVFGDMFLAEEFSRYLLETRADNVKKPGDVSELLTAATPYTSEISAHLVCSLVLDGTLEGIVFNPFPPNFDRDGELPPLELVASDLWWAFRQKGGSEGG